MRPEFRPRIIALANEPGEMDRVPLYRAAAERLVTLLKHGRRTRLTWSALNGKRRPILAVLGDDVGQSAGPGGWPQAARLLRWERVIVLNGSAARPVHYAMAVDCAVLRRRSLLVETDSAHLDDWCALTKAVASSEARVCVVAMPPGRAHPSRAAPVGATLQ